MSKSVLVADDQPDLCDAIAAALRREEFTVYTANDGDEALKVALKEKPDLIFLDIVMPHKDGLGVLQELRADPWGRDAEVIIMTFEDDMSRMAEAVTNKSNGYILKNDIDLFEIVNMAKKHTA